MKNNIDITLKEYKEKYYKNRPAKTDWPKSYILWDKYMYINKV